MKFYFKPETLKCYLPTYRFEKNGSNLVGIDDNIPNSVVVLSNVNRPDKDGKWDYRLFADLPDTYKFPDIPDQTQHAAVNLFGYFGTPLFISNLLYSEEDAARIDKLPLVIALCGESGCGKTTFAQGLKEKYGINDIVSYTTRPIRPTETDGKEHHFVTEYQKSDDELAYTFFGGNHYWARISDLAPVTTYTIDEAGILDLLELKNKKIRLLWIQIKRPDNPTDSERKARDKDRKAAQKKLKEMGETPDILIVNDYPDKETFINTEGEDLFKTLKIIPNLLN